jgi:riboflavin kinase / FMN adenylyltransferase
MTSGKKRGTVLTVGSFDGVHRGHWAVLEEIARRARAGGRTSLLVTFEPHPLEVVNPPAAPPLLTLPEERLEILAQSGVDSVAVVPFTRALSQLTPAEFVREVLLGQYAMEDLVIGYDHGFGRGREGDVEVLRRLGQELGFGVDVVPAKMDEGRAISSSLIRRAVAGGDLDSAARWLGRPYSVTGVVQRGAGRGRTIGIPTINLAPPPPRKLLPPDGVYAAWVEWRGGRAGGMMNQGPRPTFGVDQRALEVHLFDFAGDLYGEQVKIQWVRRLRDVQAFPSREALVEQLSRDRDAAVAALSGGPARTSTR